MTTDKLVINYWNASRFGQFKSESLFLTTTRKRREHEHFDGTPDLLNSVTSFREVSQRPY